MDSKQIEKLVFASLLTGTLLGIIIYVIISLMITSIFDTGQDSTTELRINSTEGVTLHGCVTSSGGSIRGAWLQNNNEYPVRVREVWNSGNGDSTQMMKLLDSGEKLVVLGYIGSNNGFYIYNKEGGLIGWLSSYCQTG